MIRVLFRFFCSRLLELCFKTCLPTDPTQRGLSSGLNTSGRLFQVGGQVKLRWLLDSLLVVLCICLLPVVAGWQLPRLTMISLILYVAVASYYVFHGFVIKTKS